MKFVFSDSLSCSYFAIRSLENLKNELDFFIPHQWYTVLIINRLSGGLVIDDYLVQLTQPLVIFVTPGQHFMFNEDADCEGYAISFNQEFYCIEYHDAEVSCNGLLFVNNYNLVQIQLDPQQQTIYNNTVTEMAGEFGNDDTLQSEMLKNLLKNLLIRSNRLFRTQNSTTDVDDVNIDFARKFSGLVEKHYKEKKQVEDYAEILGIASASLTKKLQKFGVESPSRIIKKRIVTEAKRLLLYTEKSVKEIAFILGYEDQHYFSRFFTKEAGISPSDYKRNQLKS